MTINPRAHTDDRLPVGLVSATNGDGRPLLAYDCEQHHAVGPRARALIFNDPRSRALLPLIERIAPSDANVLIMGETGTGKELVARYVHNLSDRAHAAFVAVNCGAFSESLIEGELFGYEKGAFTGANVARPGWFEAANGGTLFLDELGDLSLPLQVKLLRVLQEREVVRLGSRKAVPLNVRVIAATNVELQQAVNEGRFRADLFYRLQVVSLPLLPLRDRRADILPLARHFLEIYGTRQRAPRLELSAAAEEALFHYNWPGNIRELENAIHRGSLICEDGRIQPSHLDLGDLPKFGDTGSDSAPLEDAVQPFLDRLLHATHENLLDRLVASTVTQAFRQNGENQIKTAEALGVTRNVVRTHLKNLGLI